MKINIIERNEFVPESMVDTAYLQIDHWNDFSFVTQFYLCVFDKQGIRHDIGHVKIGFKGQTADISTYQTLKNEIFQLPGHYFSLGNDVEYYKNLHLLGEKVKEELLTSLNDLVFNPTFLEKAENEKVLQTSLLRDTSLSMIKGQFTRVLSGGAPLTDFKFTFKRPETADMSGVELGFKVQASSTPSTNIHAIIGRNGVGKTTLLNNMVKAITKNDSLAMFYTDAWLDMQPISKDYFSGLVSVSFSAFDDFSPPTEQSDPAKGACYFYIGLKNVKNTEDHRTLIDLRWDCVDALMACFRNKEKTKRWHDAIRKLGSDENFANMKLGILEEKYRETKEQSKGIQADKDEFRRYYFQNCELYLKKMSSGHAIVLLTVTRLVATVEEKTLVILDEPESHLHPPLLSAFIRALSDLLHDRNGVAIIATHSPVVLQEIPRSCVWKINRHGLVTKSTRPGIETFGENVGTLTREVFGLEVAKSGFHDLLLKSVEKGSSYQEIIDEYNGQLGIEGRALLKTLVVNRDNAAHTI